MDQAAFEKLPELIGAMEEFVGRLGLEDADAQELLASVRTIKSQLFTPSRDAELVSGRLTAIRQILERAEAGRLVSAFRKEIDSILT